MHVHYDMSSMICTKYDLIHVMYYSLAVLSDHVTLDQHHHSCTLSEFNQHKGYKILHRCIYITRYVCIAGGSINQL